MGDDFITAVSRQLSSMFFGLKVESGAVLKDEVSDLRPCTDHEFGENIVREAQGIALPGPDDIIYQIPNNYIPAREEVKEEEDDVWNPKVTVDPSQLRWKYYTNRYKEGDPEMPEDPEFPAEAIEAAVKWQGPDQTSAGDFYTNICYPATRVPKLCVGRYMRKNPEIKSFAEMDCNETAEEIFSCVGRRHGAVHENQIPFMPCTDGWVSESEKKKANNDIKQYLQTQLKIGTGQTYGKENLKYVLESKEAKSIVHDFMEQRTIPEETKSKARRQSVSHQRRDSTSGRNAHVRFSVASS